MDDDELVEITATQALARSKKVGVNGTAEADKINFTLTLNRVMKTIAASAERGERHVGYAVPWFVVDGTSVESRVLAKQLERHLQTLGYVVSRDGHKLFISWDLDLEEAERKTVEAMEAERRRVEREAKRKATFGDRPARKVTRVLPPPGLEDAQKKGKRSAREGGFTISTVKRKGATTK